LCDPPILLSGVRRGGGGRQDVAQRMEENELRKGAYLLLLLSILMSGCTSFVKEPEVLVKSLNLVSVDGGGARMELQLGVKNTNSYDIKLRGYSYDLKVMALPLAKGGAREEIAFPSDKESDVKIPIRISYGDLLEILKGRPNPDAVPYQLSAGLDIDSPLGEFTVPVKRSGTYSIPKQYRPSSLLNKLTDLFR
jgi:LEA14-like dessication related protein